MVTDFHTGKEVSIEYITNLHETRIRKIEERYDRGILFSENDLYVYCDAMAALLYARNQKANKVLIQSLDRIADLIKPFGP